MAGIVPNVRERSKEKYNDKATFLSLRSYLEQAEKIIKHFCSQPVIAVLSRNEDVISQVAQKLMEADWRYKEGMNTKQTTYRMMCGAWAIKVILNRLKGTSYKKLPPDKKVLSLNFDDDGDHSRNCDGILFSGRALKDDTAIHKDIKKEEEGFDSILCEYFLSMSDLTEKQQACIRMKYLEQMSYSEIAEATGTTVQNIQQIIANGIARMQNFMRKTNDEEVEDS